MTPADKRAAKVAKKSERPVDTETTANETTEDIKPTEMIRHKKPTIEERRVLKERQKSEKKERDAKLAEAYDKNQVDSDDSSDEEVLLRTGNVP